MSTTATASPRRSSPSPSARFTFSSKISALGAKLSRTLSHTDAGKGEYGGGGGKGGYAEEGEEHDSVAPILYKNSDTAERSTSRGRETFSTGRGGLGNIRQTSVSRDARPSTGPDDFSVTRGREPVASPKQVFSTGRGGAGNLRSPSRTPRDVQEAAEAEAAEQEVIREYVASQEHAIKSSGRGGIGNINRSRSRGPQSSVSPARPSYSPSQSHSPAPAHSNSNSHSPAPAARFSTGRGGAGNILSGSDAQAKAHAEALEEEERRIVSLSAAAHAAGGGYHSTGRGGTANMSSAPEPGVERPAHGHAHASAGYESTGRGGAGNIVFGRGE